VGKVRKKRNTHVKMVGTSAGSRNNPWHDFLRECAKKYREQRKEGEVPAKHDPNRPAAASDLRIRQKREEKERIATKRRVKGQPVHDAYHRIKEAEAGKAGRRGDGR